MYCLAETQFNTILSAKMTWYIALKIPKKKVKSRNNNFLRTHLPKHFLRFRQNSECVHWQLIKLKVMQ